MADPETQQLLSIIFRVVQIAATVMMVLVAGCTALVFLSALFAKHRRLRPTEAPSRPPSQALQSLIALARQVEFQSVGLWTDAEEGSDTGNMYTFMLSPDACILFCVRHDRLSPPHRFITPLADGRWVITSIVVDEADLSGLDDEQRLPGGFHAVLSRHRARIAAPSAAVLAFSPDSMARHMHEHEQARLDRLVAAKLAKPVPGREDQWRYTLRGAVRQASTWLRNLRQYQKLRVDQRKQPIKLRLEK
ncbi:MAG TPA: hypothetical protein VMV94_06150 [Phycisphaerae bacterium]|nr:hypothetical protein [Phycisphaerae bacterium]